MSSKPVTRRRLLVAGAGTAAAAAAAAALAAGGCGGQRGGAPGETAGSAPTTVAPETSATPQAAPADDAYWPPAHGAGEWATVDADSAGFTADGVAALVDLVAGANSQSFLLLHDARVVAEHYWGADAETTRDIASCQKSVTSTLVGMARDRNLLTFDDTVTEWLGRGWSNASAAEEAEITVGHLLTMTSGLAEATLEKNAAPGAQWEYNTNAYQKLRRVLETATGLDTEALTDDWLFTTIGASPQAQWAVRARAGTDPVGDEVWGLNLTARDMGRFGVLAMRDGWWEQERVVPEGWFAEAWTPIPQKRDYGYLWWLVGQGHLRRLGVPADAVAALGAQDQKLYVFPSARVVMCRQGEAAGRAAAAESDFDAALLAALLAARA